MSKYIAKDSMPAVRSELEFFSTPATQVGIEKSKWIEVPLRNAMSSTGPFEFVIPQTTELIMLSKNYLFMECRILDSTNQPITATVPGSGGGAATAAPYTGPINILGKTWIKMVKIMLNGQEIFDSGPNYAYRAYLESELMYGADSKLSHLKLAGYCGDADTVDAATNAGFKARAEPFRSGGFVQLMAPLHTDLFMQDKLLLPNVEVRIVLYPNSNKFCLLNYSAGEFKLDVRTLKFYVKTVEVMKSMFLGIERTLLKTPAKYPMKRVLVRTIHISAGRRSLPENDLFHGLVPRRVILGCVSSDAYYGDFQKSPFKFEPFDLRDIYIMACGEKYPSIPLNMDYTNNLYAMAYLQFMEGLGFAGSDSGNLITPAKFADGWNLYVFDLSPTQDDEGSNWNLERKGTTVFHMTFGTAITGSGVEVIIYAEFDSMLNIDNYRNVFIDYRSPGQ